MAPAAPHEQRRRGEQGFKTHRADTAGTRGRSRATVVARGGRPDWTTGWAVGEGPGGQGQSLRQPAHAHSSPVPAGCLWVWAEAGPSTRVSVRSTGTQSCQPFPLTTSEWDRKSGTGWNPENPPARGKQHTSTQPPCPRRNFFLLENVLNKTKRMQSVKIWGARERGVQGGGPHRTPASREGGLRSATSAPPSAGSNRASGTR